MKLYTEETLKQAMEQAAHDGRSGDMPPYDLSGYEAVWIGSNIEVIEKLKKIKADREEKAKIGFDTYKELRRNGREINSLIEVIDMVSQEMEERKKRAEEAFDRVSEYFK